MSPTGLLYALLTALCIINGSALDEGSIASLVEAASHLSPLASYFDVAIAVVLPSRKEYMTKFLTSTGLKFELIDAVLVDEVTPLMGDFDSMLATVCASRGVRNPVASIIAEKKRRHGAYFKDALAGSYWELSARSFSKEAEVGIFCSHFIAAAKALQLKGQRVLVFEDDVRVSDNAAAGAALSAQAEHVVTDLRTVATDWELVMFGWCNEFCSKLPDFSAHLLTPSHPLCAHAYAVTAAGALKLLMGYYDHPQINDQIIAGMVHAKALVAYSASPPLFDQGVFGSSWNKAVNNSAYGHDFCQEDGARGAWEQVQAGEFLAGRDGYQASSVVMPSQAAWHLNMGCVSPCTPLINLT